MTYYKITANFQIVRYAMTLEDAETIYNKLVNDGLNFVELSYVENYKNYTSYLLKSHL